jgi:hypothetical protein
MNFLLLISGLKASECSLLIEQHYLFLFIDLQTNHARQFKTLTSFYQRPPPPEGGENHERITHSPCGGQGAQKHISDLGLPNQWECSGSE